MVHSLSLSTQDSLIDPENMRLVEQTAQVKPTASLYYSSEKWKVFCIISFYYHLILSESGSDPDPTLCRTLEIHLISS
jgi:hypothetical protein